MVKIRIQLFLPENSISLAKVVQSMEIIYFLIQSQKVLAAEAKLNENYENVALYLFELMVDTPVEQFNAQGDENVEEIFDSIEVL